MALLWTGIDLHGGAVVEVIDDVLALSRGDLGGLISAARLALSDWRDARVAADELRG